MVRLVAISDPLTPARLEAVARGAAPPRLDGAARERLRAARAVVEEAVARGETVYGVTTGIGELASVRIAPADAERLRRTLTADPGIGVARHADAGYPEAIAVARERGVRVPMLEEA
jgi:histidine ammonia-lyase